MPVQWASATVINSVFCWEQWYTVYGEDRTFQKDKYVDKFIGEPVKEKVVLELGKGVSSDSQIPEHHSFFESSLPTGSGLAPCLWLHVEGSKAPAQQLGTVNSDACKHFGGLVSLFSFFLKHHLHPFLQKCVCANWTCFVFFHKEISRRN